MLIPHESQFFSIAGISISEYLCRFPTWSIWKSIPNQMIASFKEVAHSITECCFSDFPDPFVPICRHFKPLPSLLFWSHTSYIPLKFGLLHQIGHRYKYPQYTLLKNLWPLNCSGIPELHFQEFVSLKFVIFVFYCLAI